jgi:hypothetical protein
MLSRKEALGCALAAHRQGMGRDTYWTMDWLDLCQAQKSAGGGTHQTAEALIYTSVRKEDEICLRLMESFP